MEKNEFDIDFDFEKEFGLTAEDLMDPELDDDLDLSQFDFEDSDSNVAADTDGMDDIESFLKGDFATEEDFGEEDFPDEPAEEVAEAEEEVNLDDTRIFFENRRETSAPSGEEEIPYQEDEEEPSFTMADADPFGQEDAFQDEPVADEDFPAFEGGDDDDDDDDDDED